MSTSSIAALGPNTYLTRNDFLKMLALALLVHALAFGASALWPSDKVTNIPVRAISFKLGGASRAVAPTPPPPTDVAAPVMQASATWQATPNTPAPVTPPPLQPLLNSAVAPAPKPALQPKPAAKAGAAPAIASLPQQYVREVGSAPQPQPVATAANPPATVGAGDQSPQAVRTRYTQEISSWIMRHQLYPMEAGGREGRAVVRVRIDRAGNVRYYAIEESSGSRILDAAALDMIRRANPVPVVPANYPAGNLVEFLIPITFSAPQ